MSIPACAREHVAALDALHEAKLITTEEHATLRSCYDFMRMVEGRLRIYHNRSLDELPEAQEDLEKLARRVGCEGLNEQSAAQVFVQVLEWHMSQTRHLFNELFRASGWGMHDVPLAASR